MGVSGSGKSTLGVELSNALACPFLEGDVFHTQEAIEKMRAGEPLRDDDRWPWLDRLGQAMAVEVSRCGVAVAACSALKRSYRDRLRRSVAAPTRFVLLDGTHDVLWRRLASRADHYMPASLLSSQLATLERPQPDENILTLDAQQPPYILRDRTIDWLKGAR